MARKSVADLRRVEEDEARFLAEIKGELFTETYNKQNAETKTLIDKVAGQLRTYNRTEMDEPYLSHCINWLALEIVKDLAVTGIRLGTFKFPKAICALCGSEA